MAHELDGYELNFTSRTSWKAARRRNGELIDVLPVTWTKGLRQVGSDQFLEVWLRNAADLQRHRTSIEPFIVAIATAKNYKEFPHQFSKFISLVKVISTGVALSENSIETRVIEQIAASSDTERELKIARIAYNSRNWRRPTGEAASYEAEGTYNQEYKFGHEDWLFRDEWQIAGWRYAFLQGVNKSHTKLVKAGQSFDVVLFTVQPDKRRRYVATIREVECLDDAQADAALREFVERGWLQKMKKEIKAIGGNVEALGSVQWAKHVLNIRFRLERVTHFGKSSFASENDPVMHLNRYLLFNANKFAFDEASGSSGRAGSDQLPKYRSYIRRGTASVEVTPEHSMMQANLMKELAAQFPGARIVREENYIDVLVETEDARYLFEIKSDLSPLSVLRQAIGQLLEYAFRFPGCNRRLELIAVGRSDLSEESQRYLKHLQEKFSLPISYRVVPLRT